jgi:hypothetical protein
MDRDNIDTLITELRELRLKEEVVLERLEIALAAQSEPHSLPEPAAPPREGIFSTGQRVHLKSRSRFFKSPRDRYGTVTFFDRSTNRVWLTTDAGNETWRAPNNLAHLRTEPNYRDIPRSSSH